MIALHNNTHTVQGWLGSACCMTYRDLAPRVLMVHSCKLCAHHAYHFNLHIQGQLSMPN